MEIADKRTATGGKVDELPVEVNGTVAGFIPAGDYVLVLRQQAQEQVGLIHRAEAYVELAERGRVIATSRKAALEIPLDAIVKFSKYGAEEIHFDDEGDGQYALVRTMDIRGWHYAAD